MTSDGIRRRYGFVVVLMYVDGEIDDYFFLLLLCSAFHMSRMPQVKIEELKTIFPQLENHEPHILDRAVVEGTSSLPLYIKKNIRLIKELYHI